MPRSSPLGHDHKHGLALRTTVGLLCVCAAWAVVVGVPAGVATAKRAWIVDDDGAQCPGADVTSIQAAVNRAAPGSTIRVCPGRYEESVSVDKSLRLIGVPEVYEAVDCLAPTLPELSADDYPIVGPADATATAITLAADDVDLAGFVLRGVGLGVTTDGDYSGYRIHHSVFTRNELGVRLSSGASVESRQSSRVDHNCFRENLWGFSNESLVLVNARIDHNASVKHVVRGFEALGTRDVTFDHNLSQLDPSGIILSGTRDTRFVDNRVDRVGLAMNIGQLEPNEDLEISRNTFVHVTTPSTAIGFSPTPGGPNRHVLVRENTVTGYGTGIAIGGPPVLATGTLADSVIVGNTITNSRLNAVRLRALNTGLTVRDNILNANGAHGIHAECGYVPGTNVWACPTGNTFVANEMLGNGMLVKDTYDARDDTGIDPNGGLRALQNTWIGNRCATDFPQGTICGIG
jgi:hypothetical protein